MIRWVKNLQTSALFALVFFAQAAVAQDVTLVLQRLENGTELYVSATAETLFRSFDADPALLPHSAAHVDFAAFRQGTWDVADGVLAKTGLLIDGTDAAFEGMSFMLHPLAEALPLTTRMEGMIAISVCNAIDPAAQYGLPDLQAYAGYHSRLASAEAAVALTLPASAPGAVSAVVHDISASGVARRHDVLLVPGQTATFAPQPRHAGIAGRDMMFAALIALVALAMSVAVWRGKPGAA